MDANRRKIRVASLSVISNFSLVILKLLAGLMIGSVSILSEAIHSGVDLLAAIIALFSVRVSHLPADSRHPFGHGKVENVSGTIEALLIFLAAAWIIFEAVKKILHPEPIDAVGWGIAVMLISSVANIIVSQMLFKVGKETDSVALQADAWHLRTDVYTSAGVMVGLSLMYIAKWLFPQKDFYWIDPVSAIGVAFLILKAAFDLTVQSAQDLLDVRLPEKEEENIYKFIIENKPLVNGFHNLRTRKSGQFRFVEFHLKVNPEMTVSVSHSITEKLSVDIRNQFPETSVLIHIEPCKGSCFGKCLEGCFLTEERRNEIKKSSKIADS